EMAGINRLEGGLLTRVAAAGSFSVTPARGEKYGADTTAGRCVLEQRAIQVEDLDALPADVYPTTQEHGRSQGFRTVLNVPLMRQGQAVGTLMVGRAEPKPYSEPEISLLESFADQAVIAISNAELFQQLQDRNRELTEALDHQTATSAVLQTISRSAFDLQR